jgi:3alpha(or 20beta)-hydroxysteroid dehydrogenase
VTADGGLAGTCAIVTGGARGQGAAESRLLVGAGARVLVTDVLDDDGEALVAELGDAARYRHLDVTDETQWTDAVAAAEAAFGPVRVLVNNAGILRHGTLEQTSRAEFDVTMTINVTGSYLGMRAVTGSMARGGVGSIINISSVGGMNGPKGAIAYVTSKWAVRGMTKAAATELARYGIRVNSIHPGPIKTRMIADDSFDDAEFIERNKDRMPIRRMGTPGDVAEAVLFLASDRSSYITGAELTVDGGWAIGS